MTTETPAELRARAAKIQESANHADRNEDYRRESAAAAALLKKADELEKQQQQGKKMKISKITLRGILGIDNLDLVAGKFNQISGKNGSGKTSVLEGIKSVLRTGHDATLLKTGEKTGEAVIVLEDGMQISKHINEESSTTTVLGADGKKISRPAETLKQLTDMLSVNPVDFLRTTKKERVSVLLESMPIELDHEKLQKITDGIMADYPVGSHALVVLESIQKSIYDDRTGINRAIKEKHATINQLAATLPDAGEKEPEVSTDGILDQITAHNTARDTELRRIDAKLESMRSNSELRLSELRQKIADEQAEFSEILRKANLQREKTKEKHVADTLSLRQLLSTIEEQQKSAAKHEATRETIKTMHDQAKELQDSADKQSAALGNLEKYKSDLLSSLPIPGLTVIDGEIFRDGVQFDRLNTAQQVGIAVEIAKLRTGGLSIACVDGLELLDSEKFEEFQRQAIESGMQLFVTRVSDDEFNITTES